MGLSACDIIQEGTVSPIQRQENSVIIMSRRVIWILANILVVVLLIGAMDYSTRKNDGFKELMAKEEKTLKKSVPSTKLQYYRMKMKQVLRFPRMLQQWNMFSPSVITYEKWVIGEISFANGETINLFSSNDDIVSKFERRYFKPYNYQFWRKLFTRIGKSSYQRHIPKFKEWLKTTDYFPEYAGRKVDKVKLWKLSERSPDPGALPENRKKVTKRELKESGKFESKNRKRKVKKNTNRKSDGKLKIK